MAFDESNGNGMYMPVAPAYGGYNNGGFGGDSWAWIIILLLCGWGGMGFGGMGGWGGMGGMFFDYPWIANGQQQIMANDNGNYRDAMLNDGINGIRDGISGLSTQLCGCCSDMQMALANGFRDVSSQMYNSDMAALNRSFAEQTANMQGFNGVNSGLADLKYTLANEGCTTRAANAANTQLVLDKLCQLELDGYKREADQLRSELQYARGQASQVEQTARILAGQTAEVDTLYNRLSNCPIPSTPVYGRTAIFSCNNGNTGCGCTGNAF